MSLPRQLVRSDRSEHEQIARIRAGDVREFESLFNTYYPALRAFVDTYVDRETSEEVIQELFLALWRKREAWTPAGGVRAYLFAAARNQALNAIRKQQSASRIVKASADEGTATGGNRTQDNPMQHLDGREIESACRVAIHELPESNRLVMLLRWDYGMSHAEIAFILGTSIKGVEAELARGLRKLADRLSWLRT